MTAPTPPPEKLIGCRIRVRPESADEAAKLFDQHGVSPIYVDHRSDGDISFWFGKASDDELNRIINSIPREFFSLRAVLRGDNRALGPEKRNVS